VSLERVRLGTTCQEEGLGAPKNQLEVFEYFTLSATAAYNAGLFNRARCYAYGIEVQKNMALAVDCIEEIMVT
jgi:TPR repeat protein